MQIKQTVLITAEALGGARDSHGPWLYFLLRTQLQSALDDVEIIYRDVARIELETVDLIIGFELSAEAREKIDGMDKVYLDLRIHPVRFMDDIFLSFNTNSDSIRLKLGRYQVNNELCGLQASIVQATVCKLNKDKTIAPNSLLLIGQTECDPVLYDGNKHLSLLDRLDEIKKIAVQYDHIYFKPHPYAKNNRYLLRELRKSLGNVINIHDNIYYLLANEGVQHVVALNSSVLYETVYFDKKTTFLFNPTFTDRQVGIYGDYLNGAFWSDILSSTLRTVPSTLELPFQSSRLRKALNDFGDITKSAMELYDIVFSKISLKIY